MVLPANLSYKLAIIFPVFRELNNYCFYTVIICILFLYSNYYVLNNYCFYTENMLLDTKKVILYMKTVIM